MNSSLQVQGQTTLDFARFSTCCEDPEIDYYWHRKVLPCHIMGIESRATNRSGVGLLNLVGTKRKNASKNIWLYNIKHILKGSTEFKADNTCHFANGQNKLQNTRGIGPHKCLGSAIKYYSSTPITAAFCENRNGHVEHIKKIDIWKNLEIIMFLNIVFEVCIYVDSELISFASICYNMRISIFASICYNMRISIFASICYNMRIS
ncbi:hypothetical protein ACJX0J_041773, partial [Zea mays]